MKKGEKVKLDQAWWKKNKAKTLKTTGFGAAIKAYTDLKATLAKGGIYERNNANFDKAEKALKNLETARKKAEGMCGAMHGETKEALGSYQAVIKAEANVLKGLRKDYQKFVDDWAKKKVNNYREMPAREADWKEMKKKVAATIKTCTSSLEKGDTNAKSMSLDLAKNVKKEAEALDKKTVESCKLWRIQDTSAKPNGDDVPAEVEKQFGIWTKWMSAYPGLKNGCLEILDKAITKLS